MTEVNVLYKGTVKKYTMTDRLAAVRVPAAAACYKALLGDAVRLIVRRVAKRGGRPP